jgi:WD40 repeat protein
MYHKWAIENSPLQAYTSALIFSPACSLIRGLFKKEEPKWMTIKPAIGDEWSACLQTLEGHSGPVSSVAFSPDSAQLASASHDRTVKIWDASNGKCLQTLEGHSDWVQSVAFSPDSAQLASASDDRTVKIWDASNGKCLQTLSIGKTLLNISIDTTGLYLHTEIGTITIDASMASSITPSVTDPQSSQYKGWGLSSDGAWITHDSENLVWLPSEYRPSCSAVSGSIIGIGVGSGRVWICNFNVNNPYGSLEGYV